MSPFDPKQTLLRAMICVDGSALIRFYNKKLIRRRFAVHFLYRRIEGEISHSNFLLKCNTALVVRYFTLPGNSIGWSSVMLIPDYLAIGTLVILIFGASVRVYSERRAHRQAGQSLVLAALRNPAVPIETASKRI
jgi:hypothetical protein